MSSRGRVSLERVMPFPSPFAQSKKYLLRCFSPVRWETSFSTSLRHSGQDRGVLQASAVQAAADRSAPHTWCAPWRRKFDHTTPPPKKSRRKTATCILMGSWQSGLVDCRRRVYARILTDGQTMSAKLVLSQLPELHSTRVMHTFCDMSAQLP